jgi:phage N-6-adenine-methyltransferase
MSAATALPVNERIVSIFPSMGEAEYADFRADVEANGLLSPITVWRGEVVDGRHRARACSELGIEPRCTELPDAWGQERVVRHIVSLNLHRRHLDTSQRGLVAGRLTTTSRDKGEAVAESNRRRGSQPSASNVALDDADDTPTPVPLVTRSDAAGLLNVSEKTVERARTILDAAPELAPAIERGEVTIAGALTIVEEAPELVEAVAAGEVTPTEAAGEARERKRAHVAANSGQNEWYTPPVYLDAARAVMGGIDTDPATSEQAQQAVQAATYYTAEMNGLDHAWHGRVWMNPPYAQPLIGQFIDKLAADVANGNVTEFLVLVNNATETAWGQSLLATSTSVCFPKGRVRFVAPDGTLGAPLQGQMVAYYGPNASAFEREFSQFGGVWHG